MGVHLPDPVNLLALSGRESLLGVQAPDALHEALPPQDLMDAGDAALEVMGRIEESAVGVGDLSRQGQPPGVQLVALDRFFQFGKELHHCAGPAGPVAQKSADEVVFIGLPVFFKGEGGDEIVDDVVVVAGIQGNLVLPGREGGWISCKSSRRCKV